MIRRRMTARSADVRMPASMPLPARLLLLAAVLVLAAGCPGPRNASGPANGRNGATAPNGEKPNPRPVRSREPLPRSDPPLADIPVPLDFKLDGKASRNFASEGIRFVDHVYTGRGEMFELKRFYERYMPLSGWTQNTEIFAQNRIMLDFEKGGENCRVTIHEGGGLFSGTTVAVQVWSPGGSLRQGQSLRK